MPPNVWSVQKCRLADPLQHACANRIALKRQRLKRFPFAQMERSAQDQITDIFKLSPVYAVSYFAEYQHLPVAGGAWIFFFF